MNRATFVTTTAVLVVILFAGLAVAQRCRTSDNCADGGCCRKTFTLIPGMCTDGMLGALCGGRLDCGCLEGECRRGRCSEPMTTTTDSTEGTTTPYQPSETTASVEP